MVSALVGFVRGLNKSVIRIMTFALAIIMTFVIAGPISTAIAGAIVVGGNHQQYVVRRRKGSADIRAELIPVQHPGVYIIEKNHKFVVRTRRKRSNQLTPVMLQRFRLRQNQHQFIMGAPTA